MELNLYAIYDKGVSSIVSNTLIVSVSDVAAKRLFSQYGEKVSKEFLPDYTVVCLGKLNMTDCKFASEIREVGALASIMSLFADRVAKD